jgi:hypothetical protein
MFSLCPKAFCRKHFFLASIAVVLVCLHCVAQEEFIPPPSRLLTTIPFQLLNGGIILIRGQLDPYPDTLNFIFDTGSGGISIDSTTAARLKLHTVPSDKTIRGIAGIRTVPFAYGRTLHLPGITTDSLDFHINDYGILSSVYGENIDGIIGYSFINRFIINVDYDSSRILIYSRGMFKYPKGGFLTHPLLFSLPVEQARVKESSERNARFYFDTGAGLCLLLSSDFITDSSLLFTKKKKVVDALAQGLGGKALMKQSTLKDFRFGPYHFRNVPIYIFEDEYNITSYPSLAGLIGNDLLRRFNVILNYGRREIYLLPNSHYRDPFDYSYTGMNSYWMDGIIVVSDVMKNSPAERAGLKPGDIIVSIGNNFTGNIQTYKTILQNIGEKVPIIVRRDTKLIEVSIKVQSIF